MLVEFVKPYGVFLPGRVADLTGGVADVLLRRGIARPAPVAAGAETLPEQVVNVPSPPPEPEAPKPGKKKGK